MPVVTVQITREKKAASARPSEVLLDVLNKPLESIYLVIEEVELDNWGWGGMPTAQYRHKCLSGHIL